MIIHQDYPCTSCEHYSPDTREENHWVCDFDHNTCPHVEALHKAVGYKKRIDAEVLDKIRDEIVQEYTKFRNKSDMWNERAYGLGMALEIIDKYKAESEK